MLEAFQEYYIYRRSAPRFTAKGREATKLDSILLNGANIAMLVPGGEPTS